MACRRLGFLMAESAGEMGTPPPGRTGLREVTNLLLAVPNVTCVVACPVERPHV